MKNTRIPFPSFQKNKDRDRQMIGKPTLLETTYDQEHLQKATDLRDASSRLRPTRLQTHPRLNDQNAYYWNNSYSPSSRPYGNEVRISATPTEDSFYSQGRSNNGYDYYSHPTSQASAAHAHPSPPISPIIEATSPEERYSLRDVSPIRESFPPSTAYPETPEQPQSKFSPVTATPESTFTKRSVTAPLQSKFSPISSASPRSRFSVETPALPHSNFTAHSTPQTYHSPYLSSSPMPRYQETFKNPRRRVVSYADSLNTITTNATTATTRKPVPARAGSPPISIATNATGKALPPPPILIDPQDSTSVLQARMDDLRVRKSNVTRIIDDLKEPKPQNPLHSDIAKRREEERRLHELEEELQIIVHDETETGRTLARAWKKRADDDPDYSSVLWIQRVQS